MYFTLQEAIDSLDNVTFKTITLLESIDECVVFDNKLAIIDFNDFSINCGSGNGYAIEIKNNSHVVFNGKVGSSSSTRIGSVRIIDSTVEFNHIVIQYRKDQNGNTPNHIF